jgi:hypothetical protein
MYANNYMSWWAPSEKLIVFKKGTELEVLPLINHCAEFLHLLINTPQLIVKTGKGIIPKKDGGFDFDYSAFNTTFSDFTTKLDTDQLYFFTNSETHEVTQNPKGYYEQNKILMDDYKADKNNTKERDHFWQQVGISGDTIREIKQLYGLGWIEPVNVRFEQE